jgi:hypothetical protein
VGSVGARHRTHPGRPGGRWPALVVACVALSALVAAPAQAANGTILGAPLTIYANDNGQLQMVFAGALSGEFYNGTAAPGKGGISVAISTGNAYAIYGIRGGNSFTPVTPPSVSGDGSGGNPWILHTTYRAMAATGGQLLTVDQRVVYINGTTQVGLQYTITPVAALPDVRLYETGDILPGGGYAASGFLTGAAPTRRVGGQGLYNGVGGSGSILEIDPWSHFQEAYSATIDNAVGNVSLAALGLNDQVVSTVQSDGVGVAAQWNLGAVNPTSGAVTRSTAWSFSRTSALSLASSSAAVATGQDATVNITARTNDGLPDAGRNVLYTVTGANPTSGAVTTAPDGTAAITWTGTKVGTDTLTAFADRDGNSVWDVNTEPRQIATIIWSQGVIPPPPPPVPGKSVVVKVVSGQVFIKRPGSGRARATGPPKGFVPFTGAANIPTGSQLDTSKGRVALTSAADTGGAKTQTSDFYDGVFQVKQTLPKKKPKKPTALVTDLVMKGQIPRSQCAPLKKARSAVADATKKKKGPKSVLGKLWGNGKGKFRTDGKYSSATVRGTIWLVEDRCDGTLTQVKRGVVSVRDIKRKKTVKVKAGHSYLASAVTSKSRRKKK